MSKRTLEQLTDSQKNDLDELIMENQTPFTYDSDTELFSPPSPDISTQTGAEYLIWRESKISQESILLEIEQIDKYFHLLHTYVTEPWTKFEHEFRIALTKQSYILADNKKLQCLYDLITLCHPTNRINAILL